MDRQIYMTRQAKPRKGFDRIVLPGEIEWELTQKRRVDGIPLHKSQLQTLKELTDEFGVRVSWQSFLTDNSASAKT